MSETPKTDEAEKQSYRKTKWLIDSYRAHAINGWKFARSHERELQELIDDYVALKKYTLHLEKYLDNREKEQ